MWYERSVMNSDCTLLKVKSHCDLTVLAVSLIGFQKKKSDRFFWSSIRLFLDFLNFFNFAKPLICYAF